ncbi:hypothetical protein CTI14_66865, partial [Methylobacterium radiotolerans]
NGTAPGPVLHGRVGDRFEVTLVNDASTGHSVDFHAGSLAPDAPMRTIDPGHNGTAPGPVLHGRVGDRFEVTLVNDASTGHSVD